VDEKIKGEKGVISGARFIPEKYKKELNQESLYNGMTIDELWEKIEYAHIEDLIKIFNNRITNGNNRKQRNGDDI